MLAAMLSAVACEEPSKSFYAVRYTISEVEISVDADDPAADPEAEPTLKEIIGADVERSLPVVKGGSYAFSFEEFDGGTATLCRTADAEPLTCAFTKIPGEDNITLHLESGDCILKQSTYNSEGKRYTMFTLDLTDHYKELYPTAVVTRVRAIQRTTQM